MGPKLFQHVPDRGGWKRKWGHGELPQGDIWGKPLSMWEMNSIPVPTAASSWLATLWKGRVTLCSEADFRAAQMPGAFQRWGGGTAPCPRAWWGAGGGPGFPCL